MSEPAETAAAETATADPISEMVSALHAAALSRDPVIHALPTLTTRTPSGAALVWISRFVRSEDAGLPGFDLVAALAAENLRRTHGTGVPIGTALAKLQNPRMSNILIQRLTSCSLKSLDYELTSAVTAATDDRIRVDFQALARQVVWAYRKPRDHASWKRTVRTWASDYHRPRTSRPKDS